MAGSILRRIALAAVAVVLTGVPALAQTPSPSPTPSLLPSTEPTHSWTYYMAIATVGIAGVTLIAVVLGYLFQAPGFRRGERPSRPAGPPAAS